MYVCIVESLLRRWCISEKRINYMYGIVQNIYFHVDTLDGYRPLAMLGGRSSDAF